MLLLYQHNHSPHQYFQGSRSKHFSPPVVLLSILLTYHSQLSNSLLQTLSNLLLQTLADSQNTARLAVVFGVTDLSHKSWSTEQQAVITGRQSSLDASRLNSNTSPTGTLRSFLSWAWFTYGCLAQMVFHLSQNYLVPDALLLAKDPDYAQCVVQNSSFHNDHPLVLKAHNEIMIWNQTHNTSLRLSLHCHKLAALGEQFDRKEIDQGIHVLWQLMCDHSNRNAPILLKPAGRLPWVCPPLPWKAGKAKQRGDWFTVTLPGSQPSSHSSCWALIYQKQER